LKEHVEQYARCVLDPKCPILAWLIEYAGVLHYLWAIALPAFGESIDFEKPPGAS
jgi:hypothetical protein